MRFCSAVLSVVAVSFVSACTPGDGFSSQSLAISGGEATARDFAVSSLLYTPKNRRGQRAQFSSCTASLVAPNFLLTARHCVTDTDTETPTPLDPNDLFAAWDTELRSTSPMYEVIHYRAHPVADIAMVEIAGNPDVEPLPLNGTPAREFVGDDAKQVGFGLTAGGKEDSGTRRAGPVHVRDAVDWPGMGKTVLLENTHGHQLCPGDSGGPTILPVNGREAVVGVASFIIGECHQPGTVGFAIRTDAYMDFLLDYVADRGGQAPEVLYETETGSDGGCNAGGGSAASALALLMVASAVYGGRRRRIRPAAVGNIHDDANAGGGRSGRSRRWRAQG